MDQERAAPTIRRATLDDMMLLWQWANDALVRANSFTKDPISLEAHRLWFERKIASDATRIWIIEEVGVPLGQVRYERQVREAEVGISIAGQHRGRGLAKRLLADTALLACADLDVGTLVAYILPENRGSLAAFEAAGYGDVREVEHLGMRALRCERGCANRTIEAVS